MNIQKRALILLILLSLLAHGVALAKTETWDAEDGSIYFHRITVFEEDVPEELRQVLDANGYEDYPCYCGAMLQPVLDEDITQSFTKEDMAWALRIAGSMKALIALEAEGGRILVGLEQVSQNQWIVSHLGVKALLPGREFFITPADVVSSSYRSLRSHIAVRYPRGDGGIESYGFENRDHMWYVETYESVSVQGEGFYVESQTPFFGFMFLRLPFDENAADNPHYPAYVPPWVEYMDSIADFPTNEEDAKRISEASFKRFEGTDLALAYGVNLREKPSVSSKKLGEIINGTLVHVLGQKAGTEYPWYHVRFGEQEGWVSGKYVRFPADREFSFAKWLMRLSLVQTTGECTLRASPDQRAKKVLELPKDAQMHAMMEVDGGWLYVMVPRGEISWEIDVDGISGYVQAGEVEPFVGSSLLMPSD